MPQRVAVIGAGIIGLATAFELQEAGAEVRCYEKDTVAGAQSKGMTRIFRYAHGNTRLVELAMQSRERWRAWEQRFGRRLVGDEGLILSGAEIVPAWAAAMSAAGAPQRPVDPDEVRDLLPVIQPPHCPALLDEGAGATRVRRTVDLLRGALGSVIRIEQVTAIEPSGSGCTVRTDTGTWASDEVVIAAGVDSAELARTVGLDTPAHLTQHSRFTFDVRPEYRGLTLSCWIDDSRVFGGRHSYAQPVGTTGRYAVGVGDENEGFSLDVDPAEMSRLSRPIAVEYVREALPGLDPEPVDEIQCISPAYSFAPDGDGFLGRRRDHVTVLYGKNLFKFAPLLGALLAESALTGTLSLDLQPLATPTPST